MARPSKYTPALCAAICKRIEDGTPPAIAAQCEGVAQSTYYEWMSDPAKAEFIENVTRARAVLEAKALNEIREAYTPGQNPTPDWRAREAWLRLSNPDQYSPAVQVRTKVDQELNGALERLRAGLDRGTYERVLRTLSAETVSGPGTTAALGPGLDDDEGTD